MPQVERELKLDELEQVQCRIEVLIRGLEMMVYGDRMRVLGLFRKREGRGETLSLSSAALIGGY